MISALLAAAAVLALLTLVPGPDMAVVTQAALTGGRSSGFRVSVGIVSGLLVWGLLTVLGLSAILAASAEAYTAVKLAGAAYLIYLGVRALWQSRVSATVDGASDPAVQKAGTWKTGFTTNLLNPKIAVFYTGLLPQLVPAGWPTGPSLALLVLIHVVISIAWLSAYVVLLSRARSTFEKPKVRQMLERVTGTVLLGFGAKIALEAR
ncbi:LysE family translocator [Rhodococcus sp. OK302]|uniref:LysE family translocator n=1 Tax=Rhodococcus sp. OK302 TaxID=1882769 RepID=UPI000B93A858|nr:LysE family translocator [Rhodococcus sp. OK302]OYD67623.1 threonine/homoserine/homoserine lactone efflux protein [Rhodococcus sp. OK302]